MYLFEMFGDGYMLAVAQLQTLFAEAMLPLLIKALLATNTKRYYDDLREAVNCFFDGHVDGLLATQNNSTMPNVNQSEFLRVVPNVASTTTIFMNKLVIRSMLKVVECIRIHNFKYVFEV